MILSKSSNSPIFGVKGRGSETWLNEQSLDIPSDLFGATLTNASIVMRFGAADFMVVDNEGGALISRLRASMKSVSAEVYETPHEEVCFDLVGDHAVALFAQTCALPIAEAPSMRVIFTRVAGVTCVILPLMNGGERVYKIWVDRSYANYLWKTLSEIVKDFEGSLAHV